MSATALALAAPALAGALAYVNAKACLWHDLLVARGMLRASLATAHRQRARRLNLFGDLERWAARPDRADLPVLLQPAGRTWTYAQLCDAALRYGHWLRTHRGVRPGQVVAMLYTTSDMFIVTWMGLWSVGATPAFINHFLTGKGLAHCLKVSGAETCLVEPALAAHVQEVEADIAPIKAVVVTPEVQKQAFSGPAVRYLDEIRQSDDKDDIALLIYTSGTTGFPKAAAMSWARIIWFCVMTGNFLRLGKGHIIFSAMPLYHGLASLIGFASTLLAGGTLAFTPKFSRTTFWRDVRATNADTIIYIGEALRYLLDAPAEHDPATGASLDRAHNVKTVYGAGLRADVWPRFKARFGIDTVIELYAATDGVAGTWNVSRNALAEGAVARVGLLLRTLFFRRRTALVLVHPDTGAPLRDPRSGLCVPADPGRTGELLFKLPDADADIPSVFRGYYRDPAATEAKILRDVLRPGDAWLRSGDALRWARPGGAEEPGLLFFRDRLGDTFRWKGENVSTIEVGDAVSSHPCVAEANVYGVALPHHDGRAGCAAVSFRGGGGAPTEEERRGLAAHLRARLPRYAVPLFLRLVEPGGHAATTTGTHKQQKVALRAAGVSPVGEDGQPVTLYWLRGGAYVPFGKEEWRRMQTGRVKL